MPDMLVAGLQYRYSTIFADLLMDLGLTLLVATGTSGSVVTVWAMLVLWRASHSGFIQL